MFWQISNSVFHKNSGSEFFSSAPDEAKLFTKIFFENCNLNDLVKIFLLVPI